MPAAAVVTAVLAATAVVGALMVVRALARTGGLRGTRVDPAQVAALDARRRRDQARRLVAADPLLAHDLRIGRPDLPHSYDDGGLVDLRGAPAHVIAESCGLDAALGEQLADACVRGACSVDEALVLVGAPFPLWARIRDRAVVIDY